MATSALAGVPYPDATDLVGYGPGAFETMIEALEKLSLLRFATAVARDAAIPSPEAGMFTFLTTPKQITLYDGSVWIIIAEKTRPVVGLRKSTLQSIPNTTATAVTFDVEDGDAQAMHASGSATITIPRTGLWLVGYQFEFAGNNNGTRATWIDFNALGVRYAYSEQTNGSVTANTVNTAMGMFAFNAGDTFQLIAYQSSGGALNGGAYAWLTATWIGGL